MFINGKETVCSVEKSSFVVKYSDKEVSLSKLIKLDEYAIFLLNEDGRIYKKFLSGDSVDYGNEFLEFEKVLAKKIGGSGQVFSIHYNVFCPPGRYGHSPMFLASVHEDGKKVVRQVLFQNESDGNILSYVNYPLHEFRDYAPENKVGLVRCGGVFECDTIEDAILRIDLARIEEAQEDWPERIIIPFSLVHE